jgi:hypothetical protein
MLPRRQHSPLSWPFTPDGLTSRTCAVATVPPPDPAAGRWRRVPADPPLSRRCSDQSEPTGFYACLDASLSGETVPARDPFPLANASPRGARSAVARGRGTGLPSWACALHGVQTTPTLPAPSAPCRASIVGRLNPGRRVHSGGGAMSAFAKCRHDVPYPLPDLDSCGAASNDHYSDQQRPVSWQPPPR